MTQHMLEHIHDTSDSKTSVTYQSRSRTICRRTHARFNTSKNDFSKYIPEDTSEHMSDLVLAARNVRMHMPEHVPPEHIAAMMCQNTWAGHMPKPVCQYILPAFVQVLASPLRVGMTRSK